jgi:hypothetical protein
MMATVTSEEDVRREGADGGAEEGTGGILKVFISVRRVPSCKSSTSPLGAI